MFKKLSAIALLLALTGLTPGIMSAAPAPPQKKPAQNVSPKRHPNLARAQRQTENAFNSITAAQKANEFDLAGHAAKAKELLDQANQELKKAAEVANIGK
jgi:hypothetical protein